MINIYQLEYKIQTTANLEQYLSQNFGEPKETNEGLIFEDNLNGLWGVLFRRHYIYRNGQEKLVEQCTPSWIYLIITFLLGCIALITIAVEFTGLIGLIISVLSLPGGIGLFLLPLLLSQRKPNVFFVDKKSYEEFHVGGHLPILFRHNVSVSPVVLFNGLFALILSEPLLVPELIIIVLSLLILSIATLPLLTGSQTNPATNQIIILAAVSVWPFWITMGNLENLSYAQSSSFPEQGQLITTWAENLHPSIDETFNILFALTETPVTLIAVINLFIVLSLWYLGPKLILFIVKDEDIYEISSLVTDQLFLRLGFTLLLIVYLAFPFLALASHFLELHVIRFKSVTEILAVYWALIVIIPLSIIGWINDRRRQNNRFRQYIQSNERPSLRVEGVPVITTDLEESAAIITRKVDDQEYIFINQDLEGQLDREEFLAICYHELYHLKSNTRRFQTIAGLPIVGYLLFFAFVNPVDIHEEEFRADNYAAKNVGREATVSALEKIESEDLGPEGYTIENFVNKHGRWVAFKLLWGVPVLPLYRPERDVRISRLQESTT